ncbi:MAG: hypothetical protein HYZ73_02965 [Elusimicrobia bacterium]|nr:hypothetical protein [Elusimicrobiota bacterium]
MIPYLLILIGVLSRVVPHPPNVTPITALAIYSGVYFNKRSAWVVPLGALLISDAFLGFHPTVGYVYGSFLVIVALGVWLRNHLHVGSTVAATLLGSTFFYVVTCYGSWRQGGVIGNTFTENLIISLPFYRNMLLGDFTYVGLFFGLHKMAQLFVNKTRSVTA